VLFRSIAALQAADKARSQEEIDRRRKLAVAKALIDWGEGSRGQKGLGGIGAFGRSYIRSTDDFMGEEAGLRQSDIKQNQLMNEAKSKIQDLRIAKLKGDVAGEYKAQADFAKIAKDLGVSQNQLMARLVTGNLALLGKERSAEAQEESARIRNERPTGAGKPTKVTDQAAGVAALAAGLREEHPDWSDAKINAEATRQYKQSAGAPNVESRENIEMNKAWQKQLYTVDYLQAPDKAAYEREWKAKWTRQNPQAAAPAASSTPPPPPGFKLK